MCYALTTDEVLSTELIDECNAQCKENSDTQYTKKKDETTTCTEGAESRVTAKRTVRVDTAELQGIDRGLFSTASRDAEKQQQRQWQQP